MIIGKIVDSKNSNGRYWELIWDTRQVTTFWGRLLVLISLIFVPLIYLFNGRVDIPPGGLKLKGKEDAND